MNNVRPDEAVRRLDALYSNPKYSQLDLGQALPLLLAQTRQNEQDSSDGRATIAPLK